MTGPKVDMKSRFSGCLLGGAVGDALGAPYEGLWGASIPAEDELLAGFADYEGYPHGQWTDDTQLSLATVEGIVESGDIEYRAIARGISRFWEERTIIAPGGSCTRAAMTFLRTGDWKTCGAEPGQAGNGTAMRAAVVGLFFLRDAEGLPAAAANVSRITHHDGRSIAGGVGVAKAAQLFAVEPDLSAEAFCAAIAGVMEEFDAPFARLVLGIPELLVLALVEAVRRIASAGLTRSEFAEPIITPFVIPTVLASLWCLLRHGETWTSAVANAIRLGGDVDTLGAIVGALAGARFGASGIPTHLADSVVDSETIRGLAARYHALVMR